MNNGIRESLHWAGGFRARAGGSGLSLVRRKGCVLLVNTLAPGSRVPGVGSRLDVACRVDGVTGSRRAGSLSRGGGRILWVLRLCAFVSHSTCC